MAFLTANDYNQAIQSGDLDDIQGSADYRLLAEATAESLCRDYLAGRFDVDTAFAASGDSRYGTLVKVMIDISLFHIYKRVSPDNIPELRGFCYEESIKWLKMASRGEISPGLPIIDKATATGSIMNSATRQTNGY